MHIQAILLLAVFLAYAVVGVALRRWGHRRGLLRPTNWLPDLIFVQVWALGAVGLMVAITSPLLRGADAAYYKLGFVIGVVGFTICFAALDVVLALRMRRVARRQQ